MARSKANNEKEQQVMFDSLIEKNTPDTKKSEGKNTNKSTKSNKKTTSKSKNVKEAVSESKDDKIMKNTNKKPTRTVKAKKDRKINITQEDMDKLCEVYDWYLSIKDFVKISSMSEDKEEIVIEDKELKDTKKAYLNIDRKTWEDFDRLCSNSGYKKNEVLTQIIKDFLREHESML